jgi:hypothetical protein
MVKMRKKNFFRLRKTYQKVSENYIVFGEFKDSIDSLPFKVLLRVFLWKDGDMTLKIIDSKGSVSAIVINRKFFLEKLKEIPYY